LVNEAVLISAKEKRFITKVEDEFLSKTVVAALEEGGFSKTSDGWVKINLSGILQLSELSLILSTYEWPDCVREFIEKIQINLKEKETKVLLEIEKLLWPIKISDIDIPTYIIPIRPEWAMHLFDDDIAKQDLFGSKPTLILNAENVYYRKSNPKIPVSPARILWYVSNGKGRYSGLMQVKACSYVDEMLIDKPKVLFAKYKNLGVYEWSHVFDIADNNLDNELLAFKFSRTEIFPLPIARSSLKEMWNTQDKNFNIQGPLHITKEQFFEIYTKGMA
jgi:hypothetical protein